MSRRLLVLSVLALAGCGRYSGPVESRQQGPADPKVRGGDGQLRPVYDINEQKVRGRERYAISEDDYRIGPKGFIDRPSPTGR